MVVSLAVGRSFALSQHKLHLHAPIGAIVTIYSFCQVPSIIITFYRIIYTFYLSQRNPHCTVSAMQMILSKYCNSTEKDNALLFFLGFLTKTVKYIIMENFRHYLPIFFWDGLKLGGQKHLFTTPPPPIASMYISYSCLPNNAHTNVFLFLVML